MSVFVDTSGLYAVLDRTDRHHPEAAVTWRRLLLERTPLHTHSYVLVETGALLQSRIGLAGARAFFDDVQPVLTVEWIGAQDHAAAVAAVLAAGRRDLSLVDCASFAVMARIGLRRVFAFDRHFAERGFELVA